MQRLKDDVRQKIIRSALDEFSEKGYQKASMRSIAKRANIVSGNIYRYFKSKEDLFEGTVGPAYSILQSVKNEYANTMENSKEEFTLYGKSGNVKREVMKILETLSQSATETLILINKSEGTKYADCKDWIKQAVTGRLHGMYKFELQKKGLEPENNLIFDVIASAFIDGVCLIFERSTNGEMVNLIIQWYDIVFQDLHNRID